MNSTPSRCAIIGALLLASAMLARPQSLTINTLAGYAGPGSADGTGTSARFANPWGVAADNAGNLYVADTANHTIRKIAAGGVVSTLAGLAGVSGTNDGAGSTARFYQPQGLAVDTNGIVYVADTGNYTIRKITPAGVVTTLAGSAGNSGSANGTGSGAQFYEPEGIAVNGAGTFLYVADSWNHTIRQITSAGAVTTFAGSAGSFGSANGTGASAQFYQPEGLAVDGAGNVYVGDTGNQMIRLISSAGVVTTLAGSTNCGTANGTGTNAMFWNPQGVALDSATNLYVADSFNNTIRLVTPAGVVTTLAGATNCGSADGTGAAARFWQPQGVAVDTNGNVYVADSANGTIRMIASGAVVTTLAGSASTGSADGAGSSARFYGPSGAAVDSSGTNYVADTGNSTIRKVTAAGLVSTLAGSAGNSGTNDGNGSSARFCGPQAIAVDSSYNLYVADTANHTIRKITSAGAVSTLAGAGGTNGLTDGTGGNARFNGPQGVAVDSSGNVYVADTGNHTIRKVTSAGVVTTLAGLAGYYGDMDGASPGYGTNYYTNTARFYCPSGVAVDSSGNVYVADTRNHTIREVTAAGVVSTLAGLPGSYGSADGTNSNARFCLPQSITVDLSGNLYVLDSGNQTVRMLTPSGTNWVVTTIAGQADVVGSADGAGAGAQFCYPGGLGMNNSGSFGVADWGNNTIRAGVSSSNAAPGIVIEPQNQTVSQTSNATFSVTAIGSAPLAYQWCFYGTNLAGATASSYTVTDAQPANAGSYAVVITNSLGGATSSVATLTVVVPPAITTPPQSLTVTQGSNATFTVAASGTAPFAYQWLFNGGAISAATASGYTLADAQPYNAGSYSVIVSNFAGSVTSSPPAILTVNPVPTPPGIAIEPQNQTVSQTSNATFSVTATGSTPYYYQWLFDGASLAGATAYQYTVADAQATNAGSYSVIVTNAYGMITSSVAMLTVLVSPTIISVYPPTLTDRAGDHVAYVVSATTSGGSLSYAWYQTSSPTVLSTNNYLVLTNVQPTNAGTYYVTVTDSNGSTTSSTVTLNVLATSTLPLYPTNLVVLRVGDGAQTLSGGAGNTIYLDQYTTTGVYVSSVMVPDESAGSPYGAGSSASVPGSPALLLPGTGNDYVYSGMLTLSSNQQFLTFAAYCANYPFGGADLTAGGTGGAYWRGLATVNASGHYGLAYTNTGLYSGGNHSIRSAVTLDGTNFWTTGQAGSGGVKYVNTQNTTYNNGSGIPVISTASATGTRVVQIVGTNLIYSDAAASGGSGLYICSGTPELAPSGSTTATLLLNEGGQPNDFAISPDGRTIYIADSQTFANATTQGGGIQRWDTNSAVGGYGFSYTLPVYQVSGAQGLAVDFPTNITSWGSNVLGATLFATSPSNVLSRIVDNGPASVATVLVNTAPFNELLHGVRFAPPVVIQAIPIITWATPAAITYGTALSSNQLNAAANVPGSFAYSPTNGTVLSAGTNTLSVIFTPTDTFDYSSVTNTVSLVVSLAPLTVTAANASRLVGAANPVFTGTITGVTNGDNITATYSCSATIDSPVGTYPVTPTLVDPGNRLGNYQVTLVNGTLTVLAPPVIQSAQQSGNSFAFTWSAVTNQMYQIQSTTNLAPANWTNSGGTITATNSTMTVSVLMGANQQQFYRVVLLP